MRKRSTVYYWEAIGSCMRSVGNTSISIAHIVPMANVVKGNCNLQDSKGENEWTLISEIPLPVKM